MSNCVLKCSGLNCYTKSKLTNFNWIQSAKFNYATNSTVENPQEINDPDPKDDDKPFYWTDEQAAKKMLKGYDAPFFRDTPARNWIPGKDMYWKGELSLVGKDPVTGKYKAIMTMQYGWKVNKAGNVTVEDLTGGYQPSKFRLNSIKQAR